MTTASNEIDPELRAVQEMRDSVRFASTQREVTVRRTTGEEASATVLDESFGGLGLVVSNDLQVAVGQEVELTYNGVRMWATVQNLTPVEFGTTRWGIAWKAVGIACRARRICDPMRAKLLSDPTQRSLGRFVDMLPGGLYMMWNLFENSKWVELDEAADRLAQSGKRCGLTSLAQPVDALRKSMRAGVRLGDLRQQLDHLVNFCLEATASLVATIH